jgi:hypothetical protein
MWDATVVNAKIQQKPNWISGGYGRHGFRIGQLTMGRHDGSDEDADYFF